MPTYYIDETGFTGEDLLARDQPIFVEATTDFNAEEAGRIIEDIFGEVEARELKHSRLIKNANNQERVAELVRVIAAESGRAGTWIAHKEFALVTLIIEWWMEPLAHKHGLNFHEDGANLATANMLFCTLQGFWNAAFRRKVLKHFQRMFRARPPDRFSECEALIRSEMDKANADQKEILRYLWPSFALLGLDHVKGLPPRVLDLALPGLMLIGHKWRQRNEGPWEVVHDQSSNMAKQKWLWDALSSPNLPAAEFNFPAGAATFPMNVNETRFADSATEKSLQLCDLLAGAASVFARFSDQSDQRQRYRDNLIDAGIEKLVLGGIWPSTEVTPEGLGMKGWDGSKAIDWITKQIAANRNEIK